LSPVCMTSHSTDEFQVFRGDAQGQPSAV
jgi:hypothetical protein